MNFKEKCNELRKIILEVSYNSGKGHIGGTFSCIEILVSLYYSVKKLEDVVLLSKGHACLAIYTIMYDQGLITKDQLYSFCQDDGLPGQLDPLTVRTPWLTGSLGNMVGIASGICLSNKIDNVNEKIYVIIGDGEMGEGAFWESVIFAGQNGLQNLICIVDKNNISASQNIKDHYMFRNLKSIMGLFNWKVCDVNGHDCAELVKSMNNVNDHKPLFVIANTVKSKGLISLENTVKSHSISINKDLYSSGIGDLQ